MNFRKIFFFFVVLFFTTEAFGAKTVKIKITGSIYEPVMISIGQTGRSEVISTLPYILEVQKDELPLTLKCQSENYLYYNIDVPKKPFDTTGHVYLMKVNEAAMAQRNNMAPTKNSYAGGNMIGDKVHSGDIVGIDTQSGVNKAPITGVKNEDTVVLIITNEDYEMAANVENATNDGLAFKEYCLKTFGVPASNIRYGSNLSFGKMNKALTDAIDLAQILGEQTNLIIYYAGHGIPDNKTKDAFLMPVDSDGSDCRFCLSLSELYKTLNDAKVNRVIMFLDACFSGAQRGGDMIMAARGVRLKPKETMPAGKTIVFSATSDEEAAYSYKDQGHGLFTYFLLLKLQESKGKVKLGELAEYLREKVAIESRRINNIAQTPRVAIAPALQETWSSLSLSR